MSDSLSHHNRPPSHIEFAGETADSVSEWLKEHPVVLTEEEAREGKLFEDRARLCLQDLEDERKSKTRPLYKQITDIDDEYRSPKSILEKIRNELKERLNAWLKKEEEKRFRTLEEARRKAEEAEKAAREAEERERAAIDEARSGVESELGPLTKEADEAFKQYQQAERAVAYAEADSKVKLRSQLGGRTTTSKTLQEKELVVTDPMKALAIMGWSERLLEALGTDARLYKRKHGRFPDGVNERRF